MVADISNQSSKQASKGYMHLAHLRDERIDRIIIIIVYYNHCGPAPLGSGLYTYTSLHMNKWCVQKAFL